MALNKETLHQLLSLQEHDSALDKLKAEMDKLPTQISVLKGELDGVKGQAAQAKNKIIELEKKKKSKELELAQKEEAVRKHSADLNQVKTNEAFKALQQEMDKAKGEGGQIETEILEIMEEIDRCRKEEKAVLASVATDEKRISGEIAALERQMGELKARYDADKLVRDQSAAPVSSDIMRIYDHVRSRGKLNAVVAIDGNICSACRISLAPQVIVEATKAKSLITCESCQRILYRPEVLAAKAA
ncbi:MAG: hypothetical protein HY549_12015 [Elusimicrobia bacterium]|nr:hypothetical protein [Elusimicrobiota bacterium]